eukprot:scaffold14139_cov74-Cyclotella_meneghiniana.AAC.18
MQRRDTSDTSSSLAHTNRYSLFSLQQVCHTAEYLFLLSIFIKGTPRPQQVGGDPGGLAGAQRRLVSINGQQNENNVVSSDAKYIDIVLT